MLDTPLDDLDDPILANLNEDQRRAVTHEAGPLLVLAGAGSGKTRVITRRIAWLVRNRGVHPSRILAVTFTNKAAGEMRERVEQLLGGRDAPHWLGTFHSVCLRLLRMYGDRLGFKDGFVVYDDDDSESLLRRVMKDLDAPKELLRRYGSRIDRMKDDGVLDPGEPARPSDRGFVEVYRAYQAELLKSGAMDFGDLLAQTLRLLREHPDVRAGLQSRFDHILVDEYQDTNLAQAEIVRHLSGPGRNICVGGDDDQSIYSWRGARVENILDFKDHYPDATTVTLRSNYRCSDDILKAARRVVGFNASRHPKDLVAVRGKGEPVRVSLSFDEKGEAAFVVREVARVNALGVPLSRLAVFYRTNAQSRPFEDVLRQRRIAYRVVGAVRFYQRREVKDVLAYLRLLHNPADTVALERIVNVPPRGLGAVTIEKARAEAASSGEPLLMALARVGDAAGAALSKKIAGFVDTITTLALMAREQPALEVLRRTLEMSGYMDHLAADDSPEGQGRIENVVELSSSMQEFAATTGRTDLASYLDQVALVQPADEAGAGVDAVNLMTVHGAKGLEFDAVWVCGLEDGLFPLQGRPDHDRAPADPAKARAALEEERRLMYVAMTRARDRLTLTYAGTRTRWGMIQPSRPSKFIAEVGSAAVRVV